jgi:hypothetical protein
MLPDFTLPPSLTGLLAAFRPCFTAPTFRTGLRHGVRKSRMIDTLRSRSRWSTVTDADSWRNDLFWAGEIRRLTTRSGGS